MKYPESFKKQLMHVYPSYFGWHEMADNGDIRLLQEIIDFDVSTIFPEEIITAYEKSPEAMANLITKCRRAVEINSLYTKAMELYERIL